MIATEAIPARKSSQDALYEEAAASFGAALERLTRAYEADPDHGRDLLQEIHIALWRSLGTFDQRCSLRTWVYRVAHNVGASHVARQYRTRPEYLVDLEELENLADPLRSDVSADRSIALRKLLEMIQRLKPLDRDVILSYLEGLEADEIGLITGLSARNVATKIHRIKKHSCPPLQPGRSKTVTETSRSPMQQLWQEQPVEGTRMSVDEIRKRASKFEKRLFWRNTREYVAGSIAIVLFGYFLKTAPNSLSRIAFATLMAGMAYVLVYLYRKGGSSEAAAAETGRKCMEFFIEELERQRDLTANLWWYLGPLAPGLVLLTISSLLAPRHPHGRSVMVATDLAIVAISYGIIRLNARASRCLQRQIDELRNAEGTRN